ncbi:MAG TPA: hypothetical protein P5544_07810 [Candidatus Nanopelagicales bacterium]|nr:hypothetical protein [Candidatus Nanopelagicales bacterium]
MGLTVIGDPGRCGPVHAALLGWARSHSVPIRTEATPTPVPSPALRFLDWFERQSLRARGRVPTPLPPAQVPPGPALKEDPELMIDLSGKPTARAGLRVTLDPPPDDPASGFAEVAATAPQTRTVLTVGGTPVSSMSFPTQDTWVQNRHRLLAYQAQQILEWLAGRPHAAPVAPAPPPVRPSAVRPSAVRPSAVAAQTGRVLARDAGRVARRITGTTDEYWSVALCQGDWWEYWRSPQVVPNPPGGFLADPFLCEFRGRRALFVEEWVGGLGRGRISVCALTGGLPGQPQPIIEESFHLSFPFPVEVAGELYMIPEAGGSREVRVYRCERFPDRWVLHSVIMDDLFYADPILLAQDGLWFLLLGTDRSGVGDVNAQLAVYWSEDPLSTHWTPCPSLVTDSLQARSGGLLWDATGHPFRVRQQHGFGEYGVGVSIGRIRELSRQAFREDPVQDIRAGAGALGIHHVSAIPGLTALDFRVRRRARTTSPPPAFPDVERDPAPGAGRTWTYSGGDGSGTGY